jgi:hypothetical protein
MNKTPYEMVGELQELLFTIRRDLQQGRIVPTDQRLLPIIERLEGAESMVSHLGYRFLKTFERIAEMSQEMSAQSKICWGKSGETLATQKQNA